MGFESSNTMNEDVSYSYRVRIDGYSTCVGKLLLSRVLLTGMLRSKNIARETAALKRADGNWKLLRRALHFELNLSVCICIYV